MNEENHRIPVTVWLPGPIWIHLEKLAIARDTTIGELIAAHVVRSITKKPARRKPRPRGENARRVAELLTENLSPIQISNELGITPQRVYQIRAELAKAKANA